MDLRENRINMYMSCLVDYGFDLSYQAAYYVASKVVDGEIEWIDIWDDPKNDQRLGRDPIGFIIVTEAEDAYGLLSIYLKPEYRGYGRALTRLAKLVKSSADSNKPWMYQVRTDNDKVRSFLTQAMIHAGYKSVPMNLQMIEENGIQYVVYQWEPRPDKTVAVKKDKQLVLDENEDIDYEQLCDENDELYSQKDAAEEEKAREEELAKAVALEKEKELKERNSFMNSWNAFITKGNEAAPRAIGE